MAKIAEATITGNATLEKLGINLKGLSTEKAVIGLADLFDRIGDRQTKLALATELFGEKLAVKLIPFLSSGSDGLRALAATAATTGSAVGQAGANFSNVADNVDMAVAALRNLLIVFTELSGVTNWVNNLASGVRLMSQDVIRSYKVFDDWKTTWVAGVDSASVQLKNLREEQQKLISAFDSDATPSARRGIEQRLQSINKAIPLLEAEARAQGVLNNEREAGTGPLNNHVDISKKVNEVLSKNSEATNKVSRSTREHASAIKSATDLLGDYQNHLLSIQQEHDLYQQKINILSSSLASGAIGPRVFREELESLAKAQNEFRPETITEAIRNQTAELTAATTKTSELGAELRRQFAAGQLSETLFLKLAADANISLSPMESVKVKLKEIEAQISSNKSQLAALDELKLSGGGGFSSESISQVEDSLKGINDSFSSFDVAMGNFLQQQAREFVNIFYEADQSFSQFARNFLIQLSKMIAEFIAMEAIAAGFKALKSAFTGGATYGTGDSGWDVRSIPSPIARAAPAVSSLSSPVALGSISKRGTPFGGRGDVYVNVQNHNKDNQVEVKEATKPDGSKQIDIIVRQKVTQMFADGSMDRSFQRRYGLNPRPA